MELPPPTDSEVQRAIRNVEDAQTLLRLCRLILEDVRKGLADQPALPETERTPTAHQLP